MNYHKTIIQLHEWREKNNGNNIGYGFDQYSPTEKHHFPEAYAIWGNAYTILYKKTHDEKFLECAHKCYGWLQKNSNKKYDYPSWGLPYSYGGVDKNTSYAVTTAFVGKFYANLYKITNNPAILNDMKNIGRWLLEENGHRNLGEQSLYVEYANHPKFQAKMIYNHNAVIMDFLSNLPFHQPTYKKLMWFLEKHKNQYGLWDYSSDNYIMDNFHEALMLEGYPANPKQLKTFLDIFYSPNGRGIERALRRGRTENPLHFVVRKLKNKYVSTEPTRLWSYGATIRVLARYDVPFTHTIAQYATDTLKKPNGAYKFSEKCGDEYIRNEAHFFDGLSYLYEVKQK